MLKHKTSTAIITVLLSVLLLVCIAFAACGEEPAPTPEPEPTPPTEQVSDVERKVFQFTPEYSGEYIFFGNIYFGELEVITNEGEDPRPDADGEYRLTAGTPYTIAIEEPKFRELKLEYDISDDREVTLAPGEEYIIKLGKIYDEVKTITTGNNSISISGIYTGSPDDLEKHGNLPDVAMSSYTMPLFDDEYYIVLLNNGTEEEETEILLEDIDVVTFDSEGNTSYDLGTNDGTYIRLQDIPRGHYKITIPATDGGIRYAVYDEDLNRSSGGNTGAKEAYFSAFTDVLYLHLEITGAIDEFQENIINIEKVEDDYQWIVNGEPYHTNTIELEQGSSLELGLIVNGVTTDIEITDMDIGDSYGASVEGNIVTLAEDGAADGGYFDIFIVIDRLICSDLPRFRIVPTIAEPFAGVTFETSNDRTLMTWENVPNLYSFTYSVNGSEKREVLAGESTSLDITSYLPENARRALVEITDITYSYPVYDDSGEPTEETREVVHDDVMKFVAEY